MGCFKEQMETGHSMALALGQFFLLGTGTDWALDLGNCFLLQEIKKIIRLDWSRKTKSGQFHGGRGSHAGKYQFTSPFSGCVCVCMCYIVMLRPALLRGGRFSSR